MDADGMCSTKLVLGIMALATDDDSDFEFLSEHLWLYFYNRGKAHILRLKITCLGVVLRLARGGKDNNLELELEEHLQDVLDNMNRVFPLVVEDLKNGAKEDEDRLPLISRNVERLDLLNPDIQLVYGLISSKFSSRIIFITRSILESSMEKLIFFLGLIAAAIEDFDEYLKDEDPDFLCYTSKRCTEFEKLKNLVNHAQMVVGNLSCLLYLGFSHRNMIISDELKKFSPAQPEVREIYIKTLKGDSTSVLFDTVDLDFLDSLGDYILENLEMKLINYVPALGAVVSPILPSV